MENKYTALIYLSMNASRVLKTENQEKEKLVGIGFTDPYRTNWSLKSVNIGERNEQK